MKIYLLDYNRVIKYDLPKNNTEDFVINYKSIEGENVNITFSVTNGKWYVKSSGDVAVISNNVIQSNSVIVEYNRVDLKIGTNTISLFSIPTYDNKMKFVGYNEKMNALINIGKENKCNIRYDVPFINDIHASILYENNNYYIKSINNSRVYVNDSIINSKKLQYGDVIFIEGIIIVWMKGFFAINNPLGKVMVVDFTNFNIPISNNESVGIEEVINAKIYNAEQYFYHIPRIRNFFSEIKVRIDPPPERREKEDIPLLLSMGTSITMLGSSAVMIFSIYEGLLDKRPIIELLPQIIMVGALILGSIILPRMLQNYKNRQLSRQERKGKNKYKIYLQEKENYINGLLKQQSAIIYENNYSSNEWYSKITTTPSNMLNRILWNREIVDEDFLSIRLGIGNDNSKIIVDAPEDVFRVEDNPLLDMVFKIKEKSSKIESVPIIYSLIQNNITSFIFNCSFKDKYIKSIMMQLIASHSGNDLKLVILTSKANEKKWEYLNPLPHLWNDNHSLRFFASEQAEYAAIASYLSDELKSRVEKEKEEKKDNEKEIYKKYSPYYLIITDDYHNVKNLSIVNEILTMQNNIGFSLLTISNNMKNLPNRCEWFIQFGEQNSCIIKKELDSSQQVIFNNEYLDEEDLTLAIKRIANIPLLPKDGKSSFPTSIAFLEMMGVSKIEQLNILNRWSVNNPVASLSTIIGLNSNQEQFKLDLHEKFHGPHGLIAGSTGSGKSEFIMTFILSMAINYHPYEVQFVLIDYKGGGLAGAFENKETGIKLPHLVGTITNLDTSEMNRTLVSLQSELKRRQKKFNEVRDNLGEGTIDIYKYQRLYREGILTDPMSHLFIICDEFAELKSQQPEFMGQLISISRIGRSLGVHLILATQKPSGVVDDQIWSNAKFKICLKVQTKEDSNEMLKRPDAAAIKDVGRFFLQVGYNDYFEEGQSGWAGAMYVPTESIIKKVDDSISFINNVGFATKTINNVIKKEDRKTFGDQLSNIVKHIYNISKKENISVNKLWLDNVPANIYIENVKKQFNYKPVPYIIAPVIGIYDDPSMLRQSIFSFDLTNGTNALIYGKPGSGVDEYLQTLVWSLSIEHTPEEVNIYIIDCGAETLQIFNSFPHVGQVANASNEQMIKDILTFASKEIEYRKDLFVNLGGSYINYIKSNQNEKLPLMVFIINGIENFSELFEDMVDNVATLIRESSNYGIKFVITANSPSSIRYKLSQSIDNVITLQLSDESDYRMVLGCERGIVPQKTLGRGLFNVNKNVYEFQTAFICPVEAQVEYISKSSKYINELYKIKAKQVPSVPRKVYSGLLLANIKEKYNIPVGINLKTKEVEYFSIEKENLYLISSNDISESINNIYGFMQLLSNYKDINTIVIDFKNMLNDTINNITIINNNYKDYLAKIIQIFNNDANIPKSNLLIMIGIDSKINEEYSEISSIIENINNYHNSKIILVSDKDDLENIRYESWYSDNINSKNGIWIGSDFDTQSVITSNMMEYEDKSIISNDLGYIIKTSKYKIVKLVTKEGDRNE